MTAIAPNGPDGRTRRIRELIGEQVSVRIDATARAQLAEIDCLVTDLDPAIARLAPYRAADLDIC